MVPVLKEKKAKKFYNKCGKKVFSFALDGFYYFEDEQIEDLLDKALLKFKDRLDWRKATRAYIWSFQDIRHKICDVGYAMYALRENEDEKYDFEADDGDD